MIPPEHITRMSTLLRQMIADGSPVEEVVDVLLTADRATVTRKRAKPVFERADHAAVRRVLALVCRVRGITLGELRSDTRGTWVVQSRWLAATLLRDLPMSLPDIARELGLRDHTTVIYGLRELQRHRGLAALAAEIGAAVAEREAA